MFNIKKNGLNFVVTSDSLQVSKLIDYRLRVFVVKLNGTIGDLGTKVNEIALMDDDTLVEMDRIRSTMLVGALSEPS